MSPEQWQGSAAGLQVQTSRKREQEPFRLPMGKQGSQRDLGVAQGVGKENLEVLDSAKGRKHVLKRIKGRVERDVVIWFPAVPSSGWGRDMESRALSLPPDTPPPSLLPHQKLTSSSASSDSVCPFSSKPSFPLPPPSAVSTLTFIHMNFFSGCKPRTLRTWVKGV